MTCRGYDAKTVKIGKPVKMLAASFIDKHARGEFIRSYVKVAQSQTRSTGKNSNDSGKE